MRHMQSKSESNYVAANAWLESLGDDLDDSLQDVCVRDVYSPMKYEGDQHKNMPESSMLSGSTHAGKI